MDIINSNQPLHITTNSSGIQRDKHYTVNIHERHVAQEQYTSWNKWHPYAFTVYIEIQPLNTGDKSPEFRQDHNINLGKTSFTKRNITAEFVMFLTFQSL